MLVPKQNSQHLAIIQNAEVVSKNYKSVLPTFCVKSTLRREREVLKEGNEDKRLNPKAPSKSERAQIGQSAQRGKICK